MKALIFNIQRFSLHDGAGIRTNVFFQGCNLRCGWCSNPESQPMHPASYKGGTREYTVEELVTELVKDKAFYDTSGGGVTLTGGEPLLQLEFVRALCDALHAAGIHVAVETAAHIPAAAFQDIIPSFDLIHIDLKHHDEGAHRRGTGMGNALVLENIRAAVLSNVQTIIRIPVIPGYNDSDADMRGFAQLLKPLGAREVHLLPFHQMGENKYQELNMDYAYAGHQQLHEEDLAAFEQYFIGAGMQVQIGG